MSNNNRVYNELFTYLKTIIKQRVTVIKNLVLLMTGIFLSHSIYLSEIGTELPIEGTSDSVVQRIRRFLKNDKVDVRAIYEPIARGIIHAASVGGKIKLILDITSLTKKLKIFKISIACHHRAVPIAWIVLDKAGLTDSTTQIELLEYVAQLIPDGIEVVLAGDGEFRSVELMRWHDEKGWHFRLRMAKDTYIKENNGQWIQLQDLGLSEGQTIFLQQILVTKEHSYGPINLAATWKPGEDRPWYIATDQRADRTTLDDYKVRMWIEEMFGDYKGNGLHIDKTHLRDPHRICRLLLAMSIVYVWLIHTGSWVIKRGWRKLVDRKHRRDLSYFHIGQRWLLRRLARALSLHFGFRPYFDKSLAKVTGS